MESLRQKQPSILVVDDELVFIQLVRDYLEAHSLACMALKHGYEALRRVEQHQFPVVLLDLRMEPVDGMKVLRQLMEFENPPRVIRSDVSMRGSTSTYPYTYTIPLLITPSLH